MKKKKVLITILIVLFIYFVGGIVYGFIKPKVSKKGRVLNKVQIKGFNYLLSEDDPKIYKDEFNILKKNLESSNINYLEYAHSISKMFLIDLYNLSGKKNMYDVGGVEFVYPDNVDNYKLNVTNTLYKYMIDNSDGKREQILPTVSGVNVTSDEETTFKRKDEEYNGYKLNLEISYVEDLGYDNVVELILVRKDKYLYVVEKN